MNEELVEIGYTQKPHGVRGEIKIFVEEDFIDDLEYLEVLFLNIKGNNLPYFLEKLRGATWNIIKFDDINSPEAANKISHSTISVRKNDLQRTEEEFIEEFAEQELFYDHCTNYEIIDTHEGSLGLIQEMLAYPQQELAIIIIKDREILLPLNEFTVKKLEDDNQKIFVEMPEGIIEL